MIQTSCALFPLGFLRIRGKRWNPFINITFSSTLKKLQVNMPTHIFMEFIYSYNS